MFNYIDGMFAFAILDKTTSKIILARDRAGKKPLYLYKKDDKLLFASELIGIKETLKGVLDIDEDSIYTYLRNGFFYKNFTPYKYVHGLEAGFFYEIDCETLDVKQKKYFEILDFYKKDKITDFGYAVKKLDNILDKSVKDRLFSSELEVGAFLSGGIDSSLIVAKASKYTDKLKTFTVKFDGNFDESYLAKLMAKRYNTKHYELNISINLKEDMEKILLNYGEPFMDSSAIPSYYASKEAKKYVTVILNGDGADEIFGGYRRYVAIYNHMIKFASYLSFLTKILPKPHNKKSIYNYIYRLLIMSNKKGLDFYNSATNDIFEDTYIFKDIELLQIIDSFIYGIQDQDISELSKILYLDFVVILQSDLLKKIDIATMTNSLEGRSPFLSYDMLRFAPCLDDSFKVRGTTTKYILRELAKKYLPLELIYQPNVVLKFHSNFG